MKDKSIFLLILIRFDKIDKREEYICIHMSLSFPIMAAYAWPDFCRKLLSASVSCFSCFSMHSNFSETFPSSLPLSRSEIVKDIRVWSVGRYYFINYIMYFLSISYRTKLCIFLDRANPRNFVKIIHQFIVNITKLAKNLENLPLYYKNTSIYIWQLFDYSFK